MGMCVHTHTHIQHYFNNVESCSCILDADILMSIQSCEGLYLSMYIHEHMYVCVCIYIYADILMSIQSCEGLYVCIYVYMYMYMYAYMPMF